MATVTLVLHGDRPEAIEMGAETADWLIAGGHGVRLPKPDAAVIGRPELGVDADGLGTGVDLAVSLGGDGSILRTVELVHNSSVPVLGVNIGTLGYLTEIEPAEIRSALERFFAGGHEIDERMMITATVEVGGVVTAVSGLNEVVVEKTPAHHTVRLAVHLNDEFFTTYVADGLIVATPTGSTAYSFSARGPIVSPRHRALVFTPVAPHMLFDRSLVLAPEDRIRLEVRGERPAVVSVDGREVATLREGDQVTATAADVTARLVRLGDRDFHQILKEKFGLNER